MKVALTKKTTYNHKTCINAINMRMNHYHSHEIKNSINYIGLMMYVQVNHCLVFVMSPTIRTLYLYGPIIVKQLKGQLIRCIISVLVNSHGVLEQSCTFLGISKTVW